MSTDFNGLVEAEIERHARQWEKTEERLHGQISQLQDRIRELEVRTATRIEDVPWLVKDFNVLYRCAKQALDAAQRDGLVSPELVALQVHVNRLAPAFTGRCKVECALSGDGPSDLANTMGTVLRRLAVEDPNSPTRPSTKQLVELQNHLDGMVETGIGQTLKRADIALISWALGIASGYCELHDALDRADRSSVPRETAEAWNMAPRRRDRPRPDEELEVTWTSRSLHQALDMLMAEYIMATHKVPSKTSVLELLEWSGARLERKEGA